MDPRKNKKVKSILGFLQEDVPGAPVDAQEMDEVEAPAGTGEPLPEDMLADPNMGPPAPPQLEIEDELIRKKKKRRAASSSADAFEQALQPVNVNSSY